MLPIFSSFTTSISKVKVPISQTSKTTKLSPSTFHSLSAKSVAFSAPNNPQQPIRRYSSSTDQASNYSTRLFPAPNRSTSMPVYSSSSQPSYQLAPQNSGYSRIIEEQNAHLYEDDLYDDRNLLHPQAVIQRPQQFNSSPTRYNNPPPIQRISPAPDPNLFVIRKLGNRDHIIFDGRIGTPNYGTVTYRSSEPRNPEHHNRPEEGEEVYYDVRNDNVYHYNPETGEVKIYHLSGGTVTHMIHGSDEPAQVLFMTEDGNFTPEQAQVHSNAGLAVNVFDRAIGGIERVTGRVANIPIVGRFLDRTAPVMLPVVNSLTTIGGFIFDNDALHAPVDALFGVPGSGFMRQFSRRYSVPSPRTTQHNLPNVSSRQPRRLVVDEYREEQRGQRLLEDPQTVYDGQPAFPIRHSRQTNNPFNTSSRTGREYEEAKDRWRN